MKCLDPLQISVPHAIGANASVPSLIKVKEHTRGQKAPIIRKSNSILRPGFERLPLASQTPKRAFRVSYVYFKSRCQ
jgi:hypothetical protein